jgi:AbrB family looped-hinge helix DNA binding protein
MPATEVIMTSWIESSVSRAGRLTIPAALRARLRLRPNGKVLLQEVADGVILMSAEPLSREQVARYALDSMAQGIGAEAARLGIADEADLDRIVAVIREQNFTERYGRDPEA